MLGIKEFWAKLRGSYDSKEDLILTELENKIKYKFKNRYLLKVALTHTSYMNENIQRINYSNERFEFLGDAVLDLAIGQMLFERFPEATEGDMSKLRAKIVNEDGLMNVAKSFNLGKHIFLGKGEDISGGRIKSSIVSDCYEALIASIYIDSGLKSVFSVIKLHFEELINAIDLDKISEIDFDYKTRLQEIVQARFKIAPEYKLISEDGPDHDKIFKSAIKVRDKIYGIGTGKSKKESEQRAAKEAIEKLTNNA
jgi:ribonuclease III